MVNDPLMSGSLPQPAGGGKTYTEKSPFVLRLTLLPVYPADFAFIFVPGLQGFLPRVVSLRDLNRLSHLLPSELQML